MGGANKNHFTVGINDDVTFSSIEVKEKIDASPTDCISCKFYGVGSDGTVGSNKNSTKIIADATNKYIQAYFSYDSKKSGGITVSHLRFGDSPIKSTYLIDNADFVACHNPSYVTRYDMTSDLKKGGTFLLNCTWSTMDEFEKELPAKIKRDLATKNAKFYIINAQDIAEEIGLGNRVSTVMQAAWFKLANVIPYELAEEKMKEQIYKTFIKKRRKGCRDEPRFRRRGRENVQRN
jgi:pyruvate-ferredoxin/flavodoxin oxidoreductase